MRNKIITYFNKHKVLCIILIIISIPICVFIANILFDGGIQFGTFIRKLIELTRC